jgi:hypothetical protein
MAQAARPGNKQTAALGDPVAGGDPTLQIVENQQPRRTAEETEHAHVGAGQSGNVCVQVASA